MSFIVKDTGGGADYEPVPEGTYAATCYGLIHFGQIPDNYGGVARRVDKMLLKFEISEVMRSWKEGEPEMPAVLSKEFTVSLSEKAKLRAFMESWIGRPFKAEELKGFDIERLVGASAFIQVAHKQKANDPEKVSAVIQTIMKMPKGMPAPPMVNEREVWMYDKFDLQVLEAMPTFQKDKIKSSLEYQEIMEKLANPGKPATSGPAQTPPVLGGDEEDDSLPF